MNKDVTAIIGSKVSAAATKTWPKSATVSYKTSDASIATVDTKTGEVTGVKAGETTITATLVCGTITKTASTKVTVKSYDFQSVTQTKAAELKVVIAGDTKGIASSSIRITNTSNNVSYAVKGYDAAKGLVTTYQDMKDGKEYKVVIGDTERTFIATDGVVAEVGLESNTIVVAKETKIKAQTKDAKGVILDTVEYPGNSNGTVTITETNISAGGYITTEGLYLDKIGDTATFDVVYHSGKWDNATGTETGNVVRNGLTVTAVDAAAIDGWAVKIGNADASFKTVKETKLAVNDTDKAAYIQMTDIAKVTSTDISNFTVESSDVDTLVVSQIDDNNKNGEVILTPNKVGTAYLVIKDKNTQNVVKTLPVSIVAERKAVSLSLDKTSVSLTFGIAGGYVDKADITVTVKDQYGEDVKLDGVMAVSSSSEEVATVGEVNKGKFTVTAAGMGGADKKANATVTVKYERGTVKLEKKIAVNVATAGTESNIDGLTVDVSSAKVDAIIKADATANTEVTINAFGTEKGAKAKWLTLSDIKEMTLTKGSTTYKVNATSSSAIAINPIVPTSNPVLSATTGGSIKLNINDLVSGWKLDAGAYTLTVKAIIGNKEKTATKTIVVTDTQPKVTVNRVKTNGSSVGDCFEVYYDGKKQEAAEVTFYDARGKLVPQTGTVSVSYAVVTLEVGNNTLAQKVNIGLTVRVD